MDPNDLIKINKHKSSNNCTYVRVPAQVDKIKRIYNKYKITLIEDAWGCGKFKNNSGNLGRYWSFSFDFAKTLTTGEGACYI